MSYHVDAIYENGVFRPVVPLNIASGQRVSLDVETKSASIDDLADVSDLLDQEFTDSCRRNGGSAPTLEEARRLLRAFDGTLAELISAERDER